MDCNLVSFSNLHLFEQLRQDDSFSFDRSKIKFIGPTKGTHRSSYESVAL